MTIEQLEARILRLEAELTVAHDETERHHRMAETYILKFEVLRTEMVAARAQILELKRHQKLSGKTYERKS